MTIQSVAPRIRLGQAPRLSGIPRLRKDRVMIAIHIGVPTSDLIVVPDTAKKPTDQGDILAVGPDVRECQPGDTAIGIDQDFGEHGILPDGRYVKIVRERDIQALLK